MCQSLCQILRYNKLSRGLSSKRAIKGSKEVYISLDLGNN